MGKNKIKIKEIKNKTKIKEIVPDKEPPTRFGEHHAEETHEGIEAKTKDEVAFVLKSENRSMQGSSSKENKPVQKDEEHIFISYDRFGMSNAEKMRAYSLKLGSEPSRQTLNLSPENRSISGMSHNSGEIHLERSGNSRAVSLDTESMAAQRAQREYMEGSAVKYKEHRKNDSSRY